MLNMVLGCLNFFFKWDKNVLHKPYVMVSGKILNLEPSKYYTNSLHQRQVTKMCTQLLWIIDRVNYSNFQWTQKWPNSKNKHLQIVKILKYKLSRSPWQWFENFTVLYMYFMFAPNWQSIIIFSDQDLSDLFEDENSQAGDVKKLVLIGLKVSVHHVTS